MTSSKSLYLLTLPLNTCLPFLFPGEFKPTQAELLADAVAHHGVKVLIVHGENDALVPASNSHRLAALLPNAKLVVMPRTGHVPHEEHPDDFLRIVQDFMRSDLEHNQRQ